MRFLLCFVLSWSLTAIAAPKKDPKKPDPAAVEQAAKIYADAEASYKLQNYEEALKGFADAYQLSKEPALLFNIAQCQRFLGRLEDAKKSYQTFLRDQPNNVLSANAKARIEEIDAEIKRLATKGTIKLSSNQDPTEIFLDGVSKGPSPLTLNEVEPGAHKITVKKVGFVDYNITITVEPGALSEINIPQLTEPGIQVPKLLFTTSVALGGAAVLSSGGFISFGLLSKKEQNSPTAQANLAEEINRIETRASVSRGLGIAAVGMASGAIISAGVGYLLKKRTHQEASPAPQGNQP